MAATKKSAKRSATKKRTSAKARKKSAAKSSSRRASSTKAKARKGLKAARAGLGSVIQAGGKTWKSLKSTTAQVVEDVKGKLAGDARRRAKRSRRG
jgi:hypothetical protein